MAFGDLTVDVLMQRTGMTRSSFYHYFHGLDDLVLGLLVRFEQDLLDSVEPWLSGREPTGEAGQGGRERLLETTETALTRMLHVFRQHGPMIRAVNQAASGNPAVYAHWQTRVIGAFIDQTTGFIEAQVAGGLSRARDPQRLANALIRMNSAVVQENLARERPDEPEAVARVLADIWNAAIYGGPLPAI